MKNRRIGNILKNSARNLLFICMMLACGCKKYLNIPPPTDSITGSSAFADDNTTAAVVTGLFFYMTSGSYFNYQTGITYSTGLYTDELQNLNANIPTNQAFYTDAIQPGTSVQWSAMYANLYQANLAIEGIQNSKALLYHKDQWLGECYFTRALLFFYLTNLYGSAVITISTDRQLNSKLPRSSQQQIYSQIIADLLQAQTLLNDDYRDGAGNPTSDRTRPDRAAATALLARVYLYSGNWIKAETAAGAIIENTSYQLTSLNDVFLSGSKELIWGLAPLTPNGIVSDYTLFTYNMPASLPPGKTPLNYAVNASLSDSMINSFEPGDQRFSVWVRPVNLTPSSLLTGASYYFPYKYRSAVNGVEYMSMLRLAEQYLIRSEARVIQNNLSGALSDLNMIRQRAGLPPSLAVSKTDIQKAIMKERRTELFTECGNRLFDLRRTGTLDAVMQAAATAKGGSWASYKQYWPISTADITLDPQLAQTPGY